MLLEVLHELVDAVASLRAITGNRQAELHAKLDEAAGVPAEAPAVPKPAPKSADGPAGA
jgi:hypothetical protein